LNEELQATVEELNTTNDDLQAQTVELQRLAIEAESARKQLRTILDGIDAAIVVVEGNGAILLENEAHARLFADAGNGPVLVDEQGNPLAKEAYPIQRAATATPSSCNAGSKPRMEYAGLPPRGLPCRRSAAAPWLWYRCVRPMLPRGIADSRQCPTGEQALRQGETGCMDSAVCELRLMSVHSLFRSRDLMKVDTLVR